MIFASSTAAFAVAPRTLPAGDTMYVFGCKTNNTNPPGVGTVTETGVVTQVAAFPAAPYDRSCFQGPAYDPTTGLIYVLQTNASAPLSLWIFNPATNQFAISPTADVTACGPVNLAIDSQGHAYAQTKSTGAAAPDSLVSINLATGACSSRIGSAFTTSIGSGFIGFGGFSFNLNDNVLYATDYDSGNFYSIDISTAAVTPFVNSSFGYQNSSGSVAFDSTGMTWISFGDRPMQLESSPWTTYNTNKASQGAYDFNGAPTTYAMGLSIIPAGHTPPAPAPAPAPSPAPTPAPQPSTPALAETGVNPLPYLAGGFTLIAMGIVLIIARRKKMN